MKQKPQGDYINIEGARQNNLKAVNLRLPLNRLIVVTGVSGSGKSSLAFDTIYSEGQRRYVETFSAYTRQFLDRMDRPKVDRIDGIPPAIAVNQTNPVRTSRSTVGTMTELNDHIKLLFARAARLFCRGCGKPVHRDTPDSIWEKLLVMTGLKAVSMAGSKACSHEVQHDVTQKTGSGTPEERRLARRPDLPGGMKISEVDSPKNRGREKKPVIIEQRVLITFPITIPFGFSEQEVIKLLGLQGYRRILKKDRNILEVIQDRVGLCEKNRIRVVEGLEAALKYGRGCVNVYKVPEGREPLRFSEDLLCPDCDIHYNDPVPNLFSFNSPIGACETCRGFGRTIGIDYDLVVPDDSRTLAQGAVKPWQTASYSECQSDLMSFARRRGIPTDVPWHGLTETQKRWVLEGEGEWEDGRWYGVKRFFDWLETKSYRMHIRVLLSRYRIYQMCPDCRGARLKPDALLWRIGAERGLNIHEVMLMPIDRCFEFFKQLKLPQPLNEATELLLKEIRLRLGYLDEVGLGYITLDRQSRTLSGGEVQRINLTTALGTSLVNALFVLDEPSIGLHPRDIGRLIQVLHRLRDAGNTLIIVEHDPDVIRAGDVIVDMGPGAGDRGGEVVFFGRLNELLRSERSLTAQYLSGKKTVLHNEGAAEVQACVLGGRSPGISGSHETLITGREARCIEIIGAGEHNLKNIDVRIPLDRLVCITGVSGSGKSTLVQDVLYNAIRKLKHRPVETPGCHRDILGHGLIDDVVMVDQSPIGRTTRSNPASYVGAFNLIRKIFSFEPLARERDYTPGSFSFNSGKGRCPTCGGNGFEHIEMQFLSDVYLRCPDCEGRRYRTEVLDVKLLPPVFRGRGKSIKRIKERQTATYAGTEGDKVIAKSIADVLDMTVSEACGFFSGAPEILRALEPLSAVGLDYMTLGQPVPTLSGGEAQRLKLAGHLAGSRGRRKDGQHILFLFDEPTTGLHFDDIATLLHAFRQLLKAGHSVVVIEHNLEVIRSADWIIDLGPEGGDHGGEVVCTGQPSDVAMCERSHTGKALANLAGFREKSVEVTDGVEHGAVFKSRRFREGGYEKGVFIKNGWPERTVPAVAEPWAPYTSASKESILIRHAREHNLKNIDVRIPRSTFTVITGVSGSGKSTVAFDILFNEGQRRYLESLNAYARQFVQPASRPDVDGVFGVPPTVAIEQRVSSGGWKSTVATMTEIYHFLRLLFARLGVQYCTDCDVPIEPQTPQAILAKLMREYRGKRVLLLAPMVTGRKGYYTVLAGWAAGRGYTQLRVDGRLIPTDNWPRLDRFHDHNIELPVGEVEVVTDNEREILRMLDLALGLGKGVVYAAVKKRGAHSMLSEWSETIFSTKRSCPRCGRGYKELDPRLFSFNSKYGWCPRCFGTGFLLPGFDEDQTGREIRWNRWQEAEGAVCTECNGLRLSDQALSVKFRNRSIADLTKRSIESAEKYFKTLKYRGNEEEIARDIVSELISRLTFLRQVGLPYLTLDRAAPTLSSGEAQRIRLASQLGSNLRGVCYILDEPTIGLHVRDNRMLLKTLHRLKARGNTVVVVEHDEETIRQAEHIVDLGPGGGVNGGKLVAEGTIDELMKNQESLTAKFLRDPLRHPLKEGLSLKEQSGFGLARLEIVNARLHNLKKLLVTIPLGWLVCVTGVSGSGKSTLVRDVLYRNMKNLIVNMRYHRKSSSVISMLGCDRIEGWESVKRVLEVDQTPIGKTPRSCPATYVGFWDDIRRLYAATGEARMRGYTASRFSFNTAGGRCEECGGQGLKKIKMSFLPDVSVICDACGGRRFTPETLAVMYKKKSIADVLAMSVDEAVDFFAHHPKIYHALGILKEVGLGYLTLGQQSPTLSGGEAQRIKLVTELAKTRPDFSTLPVRKKEAVKAPMSTANSLYIMDEPTIGLHMADVEKLILVLRRLVDAGNTVVVIEHNLDVIAEADWIIDLGPEGGNRGGEIVAQGPPGAVARVRKGSYTARFLSRFLKNRSLLK